ncbi:aldehyde dehydrogenase family protein [Desulforhopalus sp. 52FAK]
MSVDDKALENMITSVFMEMMNTQQHADCGSGIHETIDQAVAVAKAAQPRFVSLPLEKRKTIIDAIKAVALASAKEWAIAAASETGLGRAEDKVQENILAATKTRDLDDLVQNAVSGDKGLTLTEYAPFGVIGSLTPVTNPTGTLIHNTISMIAGGNTVVFNPHPSSVGICTTVIKAFHKAIVDNGGPEGVVGMIKSPNMASAKDVMSHPDIDFLVATGGKAVVTAVLSSGKKAIGAGAGNPPVLVDETACIRNAARDIINGHSINNNIFCIAEKQVIVVDEVADNLMKFMAETGKAAILNKEQAQKITDLVVKADGHINGKFIGKDISIILKAAGFNELAANENLRCVVFETDRNHPLVWLEQMMPVLPLVRVKDVWEGIDLAVETEQGNRHTAMMHSVNIEHLTALARAIQTTIFVKNGPSYAGIGLNGEGHSTFTIAGPTGEGLTSARSFCRQRRCVLIDGFRII